jgi:hypothetical protein
VDSVPDPLLFFSGSAGNRIRASGSVAKTVIEAINQHEAGSVIFQNIKFFIITVAITQSPTSETIRNYSPAGVDE